MLKLSLFFLIVLTFYSAHVFSVYNPLAHGLNRNPNEICLSNLKDVVVEPFLAIDKKTPEMLVQRRINIRFRSDSKFDKYFEFPEDGPIDFPYSDLDIAIAPQGRAIDLGVKIRKFYMDNIYFSFGGRTLEGGADNNKVYTMSWFNFISLDFGVIL